MMKNFVQKLTGLDSKAIALRFVLMFGVISLFADFTYEGSRSIVGPYLAQLGASGTAVGIIAGLGELLGYGLRLVSGRVAEKTAFWPCHVYQDGADTVQACEDPSMARFSPYARAHNARARKAESMALSQTSWSQMILNLMLPLPVILESQDDMSVVGGTTIEPRTHVNRPDDENIRCSVSNVRGQPKDFSQLTQPPTTLSTSNVISFLHGRTEPFACRL